MKNTALGYGAMGLIPFVSIGMFFPLWPDSIQAGLIHLFFSYSVVILAFMAGAVWGSSINKAQSDQTPLSLTVAIVFSLVAFSVSVMPLSFSLVVLGCAFVVLFSIELFIVARKVYPFWYTLMRAALTSVVFICHGTLWFWLDRAEPSVFASAPSWGLGG
ncbi:DUF3429 domain-containing protein [Veronia pacifica]|uniref:DUF3429 domain-containing protein n=1 Tax=Veronia pacifica TaxID=1080227 RepID=A0A1C3ER08_9GAMM|nr:DUF3429 domain-containing protein [Veronia pacifica]ODA35629.1 hypothetical protein A8L45_03145 [Veronia pacifica]